MIKVGLTGGIGSGKTLVGGIFKHLGIPVFHADNEAKVILNSDTQVIRQIKEEFGEEYYTSQGIDRKKLAELVFNDSNALSKLNAIIHPRVRQYFMEWIKKQHALYVLEEAAILFESKAHKEMDFTINVHADEQIRIQRVIDRDKTTSEDVKNRMRNQMSDQERIELADFTIYNDCSQMVLPQVLDIHHKMTNK